MTVDARYNVAKMPKGTFYRLTENRTLEYSAGDRREIKEQDDTQTWDFDSLYKATEFLRYHMDDEVKIYPVKYGLESLEYNVYTIEAMMINPDDETEYLGVNADGEVVDICRVDPLEYVDCLEDENPQIYKARQRALQSYYDFLDYKEEGYCGIRDYLPEEGKYLINMNPLMDDEEFEGTLDEAMAYVDENACYNQYPYRICNTIHELEAERMWHGVAYDKDEDDCEDPICFGDFGYYADWELY